jgi:carboxyl-terminal processing protease
MHGGFDGIGIEFSIIDDTIYVVAPIEGGPSEKLGIQAGDRIVKVDGESVAGTEVTNADVMRLLKGPKGTEVEVSILRRGEDELLEFNITRDVIPIHSISFAYMINEETGYIKVTRFAEKTYAEFAHELEELIAQGMKNLILDLRGNPGGLLETAAAVLDRFLDNGVLVSTRGRAPEQNQVFRAHNYNTRKYPLALIIDENSASASEIVAGAIRDHRRGTIIGRSSYGKWSVQSIIHLPGQTGLKLTTAKFYSPADHNYAGVGMEPDVLVPEPKDARVSFYRGRTVDDIRADMDVARAIEVLAGRLSQN